MIGYDVGVLVLMASYCVAQLTYLLVQALREARRRRRRRARRPVRRLQRRLRAARAQIAELQAAKP